MTRNPFPCKILHCKIGRPIPTGRGAHHGNRFRSTQHIPNIVVRIVIHHGLLKRIENKGTAEVTS